MRLVCTAFLGVALAGCGGDEPAPGRTTTAQATVTPAPTPEKPTLHGHRLRSTTIDDRDAVARVVRKQVHRLFERNDQPSKVDWTGCDRVHEGTLTTACFIRTADGFEDVVIVWADPKTRDVTGYKAYSGLTCGEREQRLAGRQAEAIARLTHPQTSDQRPRPTKKQIQRGIRKEMDRRCAKGSSGTVPGNEAVEAVVGVPVKVRRRK
jgi:hypothetical protein